MKVLNSLSYVQALYQNKVPTEYHIFPKGMHGLGLANQNDEPFRVHVSQWSGLLIKWLGQLSDSEK